MRHNITVPQFHPEGKIGLVEQLVEERIGPGKKHDGTTSKAPQIAHFQRGILVP
jgi:hypothetical protein